MTIAELAQALAAEAPPLTGNQKHLIAQLMSEASRLRSTADPSR